MRMLSPKKKSFLSAYIKLGRIRFLNTCTSSKSLTVTQSNQNIHVQVCNDTNARFQLLRISADPLSLICNLAVCISEENESKDNVSYKPPTQAEKDK